MSETHPIGERLKRLEDALRPFATAAQLFTSGVHNGGLENVQAFPTAQEWRIAGGLLTETNCLWRTPEQLRATLRKDEDERA